MFLRKSEIRKSVVLSLIIILILSSGVVFSSNSDTGLGTEEQIREIEAYLEDNFKKLKSPGISIGITVNDKEYFINKGQYSENNSREVSENTRYELASISKSFTGLAIKQLEREHLLSLDDNVSDYIKGFTGVKDGKVYEIKIIELLYHTSGIKNSDLKRIKDDSYGKTLIETVESLSGIELGHAPGTKFEYSSVNYDVLGAIIEVASKKSYKNYMEEDVLAPLGMFDTYVGVDYLDDDYAPGHKITMYKTREYEAPIFTGNTPAGYIISTTKDMLTWNKLQYLNHEKKDLLESAHVGSFTPKPLGDVIYTSGWFKQVSDKEIIFHGGNNPGFTSYMSINKTDELSIILLSNSNSASIQEFGANIFAYLNGGSLNKLESDSNGIDSMFSAVVIIAGLIICISTSFFVLIIFELKKKKRMLAVTRKSLTKLFLLIIYLLPIGLGLYMIPMILRGTDWYMTRIWSTDSVDYSIVMVAVAAFWSYMVYSFHVLFPLKDSYFANAPELIVCGIVSGLSNAATIMIITNVVSGNEQGIYMFYYFAIAIGLYISCRKVLEVRLTTLTQTIIKNTRELIFNKLFNSSYTEFLSIKEGELTAVLTTDINQVSSIATIAVSLVTSIITVIASFAYLASLSLTGTIIIIVVIVVIASIYSFFNGRAMRHFSKSRETQSLFLEKVEGLIKGFKDISLQNKKKSAYIGEIKNVNKDFMDNNVSAFKMFINAFLLGESFFIIVLGGVTFSLSILFGAGKGQISMQFVIILIYMLNPINMILNTVPRIAQVKIAIDRIKNLIGELPEKNEVLISEENFSEANIKKVKINDITYKYSSDGDKGFQVGPISLEVSKGEILFIIGGNGSGKSTLIHLLTGLFESSHGKVTLNDKEVSTDLRGEQISAVFADSYLFNKLYNIDLTDKMNLVAEHLKNFNLDGKVSIENNSFSTVNLSTGQKKRLHLLRVILEDKPILIFDELAADQDPEFRKYFYRELLPELRGQGKIIIAVTHDDHYFDVADKVIKLDLGLIEDISRHYTA